MTTRLDDDRIFSAADMANRRASKELEGYSRAFAVRDRLRAGDDDGSKPKDEAARHAEGDLSLRVDG